MKTKSSSIASQYHLYYKHAFSSYRLDFPKIIKTIESCPPGPIVEMGAGFGRIIAAVEEAGNPRQLLLVESDPEMLALLREQVAQKSFCHILETDAAKLPLDSNSVAGVILAANSIAEMRPLAFVMAEAARVLKEDGLMFLWSENPDFTETYIPYYRTSVLDNEPHTFFIDSFPIPRLGRFSFQTHFLCRNSHSEHTYIIPQTFPSLQYWKELFATLGLEIIELTGSREGHPFYPKKSDLISIIAKKTAPNLVVDQTKLRDRYDQMAVSYDTVMTTVQYAVPEWISKRSKAWQGMIVNVLDLACGNGWLPTLLKREGIQPKTYGIDFSPQMIEQSQKQGTYQGLLCADLSNGIPIAEDYAFEIITAFGLTEFISDSGKLLSDIRRLLTMGGEAWIAFEKTTASSPPFAETIAALGVKKYHYSKEAIQDLFTQSGLVILEIEENVGYRSPTSNEAIPYFFIRARRGSQ